MIFERAVHMSEFVRLAETETNWLGSAPAQWARALNSCDIASLPSKSLKRSDLRKFCRDANNSDEACFVACMAWGGMNRKHGRAAWIERTKWLPIVNFLRRGTLGREEAYRLFADAEISGLGPAYFTKMIFFMRPETDGYILDQWTGKSVSLLFSPVFIEITSAGWVSRANDATVYRRYCGAVENLAMKMDVSGERAEEMMFSQGGRRKSAWREYVVLHWMADKRSRLRE